MINKRGKIDFKYNIKIYLDILKKYKILLLGLLITILILETAFIADRYLFKIIIDKGTEFLSDKLDSNSLIKILINVIFVFFILLLIRSIGNWLKIHLVNILDANLILDLKRKFFNHLIHLSHGFHISHKTGSLISRLIRGSRAIEGITDVFVFNVAPLVFQIIIIGGSLIYFDWTSALVVFLTGIIFTPSIVGLAE